MTEIDFSVLTVLIVDDEAYMRSLVRRVLHDVGVRRVREAKNGMEGFSLLDSGEESFDLIICDLEMPVMDGFQFVFYLRQDTEKPYVDIPILILTGHTEQESVETAAKLGINGYVAKPVSANTLKARMSAAMSSPKIETRT